jgi:hypothetical protein
MGSSRICLRSHFFPAFFHSMVIFQVLLVLKVPPALLDFRVVPEPSALLVQRVLLVLSGPGGLLALLVSLA